MFLNYLFVGVLIPAALGFHIIPAPRIKLLRLDPPKQQLGPRAINRVQKKNQFRSITYLKNSHNDDAENPDGDTEDESLSSQEPNMFESMWESPLFATFLFWVPFVANPRLRYRFSTFVSENIDLTIAIPVSVLGIAVAIGFVSYQNRLADIEVARYATEDTLRILRGLRSAQMTGSGGENIEGEYEMALKKYDDALRGEVKLRNSLKSLPFKAPNDTEGPDIAAAKQFLGIETNNEGDLII
jgi:hypothetical protein